MAYNQNQNLNPDEFEELDFEGEISEESSGFTLLQEGDYDFTVNKVSRTRYSGGDNIPACNEVDVEISVWGANGQHTLQKVRFFLVKKFEWKLSQFFLCLGIKKHNEPLRMRWNIEGMNGKCKLEVRDYTTKDGRHGQSNEVKYFYAYDEEVTTALNAPQTNQMQAQPMYQQPVRQYAPPMQQAYQQPIQTPYQPQPQSAPTQAHGGWKPGAF